HVFLTPAIADVVDLSQPIDGALFGNVHSAGWLVSFGIISLNDAKERLSESFVLAPREHGGIRLYPREDADAKFRCELRPSAGPTSCRLVCGDPLQQLSDGAAYLARTVPRQELTADARLEVHTGTWVRDELASTPTEDSA